MKKKQIFILSIAMATIALGFYWLSMPMYRNPTSSPPQKALPSMSVNYIRRYYIEEGDLLFRSEKYSEAYDAYSKAKKSLIELRKNYKQRTSSELADASKDELSDLILVVENRILLATTAINYQKKMVNN